MNIYTLSRRRLVEILKARCDEADIPPSRRDVVEREPLTGGFHLAEEFSDSVNRMD